MNKVNRLTHNIRPYRSASSQTKKTAQFDCRNTFVRHSDKTTNRRTYRRLPPPPLLTVSELRLEMVRDNAEIYRPVLTMDPGTASGQRRPRLKLYCTVLVLYCTVLYCTASGQRRGRPRLKPQQIRRSGHQVRRNILVRAVAISNCA